ncbi:putative glycine dehydrogenase (decarboxylating) subunit [Dirofilaria immitis]
MERSIVYLILRFQLTFRKIKKKEIKEGTIDSGIKNPYQYFPFSNEPVLLPCGTELCLSVSKHNRSLGKTENGISMKERLKIVKIATTKHFEFIISSLLAFDSSFI